MRERRREALSARPRTATGSPRSRTSPSARCKSPASSSWSSTSSRAGTSRAMGRPRSVTSTRPPFRTALKTPAAFCCRARTPILRMCVDVAQSADWANRSGRGPPSTCRRLSMRQSGSRRRAHSDDASESRPEAVWWIRRCHRVALRGGKREVLIAASLRSGDRATRAVFGGLIQTAVGRARGHGVLATKYSG